MILFKELLFFFWGGVFFPFRGFFLLLFSLLNSLILAPQKTQSFSLRNTKSRAKVRVRTRLFLFSRPPPFVVVVVVVRFGWCLVEILLVCPIRARTNWNSFGFEFAARFELERIGRW